MINILGQNIILYFEWIMDKLWTFETLDYYADAKVPDIQSQLFVGSDSES